jgi:hypothetical protein
LACVAHANNSPQPWYPVKLGATNKKDDTGDRNKKPIPSAVLASFICLQNETQNEKLFAKTKA